jgi:hypothetical protein
VADPVLSFVLEALRPGFMGPNAESLPKPGFVGESAAWERVIETLSRVDAVAPVLVSIDRSNWKSELPEVTLLRIDERLRRERMRLSILENELDSALFLLINARVPFAVVDGVDTGRRFYPHKIFRPVSTVDLLVSPADYALALDSLGHGEYRAIKKEHHATWLTKKDGSPVVRIRRSLTPYDSDEATNIVFDRSKPGLIPGLPAVSRALDKEDLLVYVIRDGAVRNMLLSPVLLNDLYFVLKDPELNAKADWEKIIWSLAQSDALSGAWYAMKLLESQCGYAPPTPIRDMLDRRVGGIRKRMLSRLADPVEWFRLRDRRASSILLSRLAVDDAAARRLPEAIKFALEVESSGKPTHAPDQEHQGG